MIHREDHKIYRSLLISNNGTFRRSSDAREIQTAPPFRRDHREAETGIIFLSRYKIQIHRGAFLRCDNQGARTW